MRRVVLVSSALALAAPGRAAASPYTGLSAMIDAQPAASEPAAAEPPAGDTPEPTSSKAPSSSSDVPPPVDPSTTTPEPDPIEDSSIESELEPEDTTTDLAAERKKAKKDIRNFNRHAIGVRGGITVIPTWILARWLDTHGNALCRGDSLGNFAQSRGLLKTKGCNFYVGLDYTYRLSRIVDVVAAVGYQHAHAPDAMWLDKGQFAVNGNGGADYTEVKLGMVFLEADFIARAPLYVGDDFEFDLGGGGGIGLGIVTGGLYQTAIGAAPAGFDNGSEDLNSCTTTEDLADFRRCTPRYDPMESGADPDFDPNDLSEPNTQGYANCTADECNINDLKSFGYRNKNKDVWPVIPVINLILSMRFIIKDSVGISINGGFQTGFYFGGGIQYFFGKKFQKGPTMDSEPKNTEGPSASRRKKKGWPTWASINAAQTRSGYVPR
jgi:hypothetical protein